MATSTTATIPQGRTATTAPAGASAPLSTFGVLKSALVFLGVSIGGLVALRLAFGEGAQLPKMRVDATEVAKVWAAYQTINIPLKIIAFHYHGHSFSQAILTFT